MRRNQLVILTLAGIVAISIVLMVRMRHSHSRSPQLRGTSAIVLIDFSKSFVTWDHQGRTHGLRYEDRRALSIAAGAMNELALRYWTPPVKVIWTRIQTSSITAEPLCTFDITPKLVKTESDTISSEEEIREAMKKCVDSVVEASKNERLLSNYTDISGALSMASEMSSTARSERVLIILSDFKEDLPPGSKKATFELAGERVIMLHRPGTDEPESVAGYLARIADWKTKLLKHGAKSVVALPVFAVTQKRLRAALHPQDIEQHGTDVNILIDFKRHVFQTLVNKRAGSRLVQIGKTLANLARDWAPPVTVSWMTMGPSGFASKTFPPIEFTPSLIKKENMINTIEEFATAMEEVARAIPNMSRSINATDISGSLALACAVEPRAKSQVLVVISDFIDSTTSPMVFELGSKARVIMLHIASPTDRLDPNAYAARRRAWEQRFKQSGAKAVCQLPLVSFTANDLRSCLSASN